MNRAIPPLLAVLLGFSLLVAPIVAAPGNNLSATSGSSFQQLSTADGSDSDLQVLENTTNRLSLENVARSEHARPSYGVGTMLASMDDEIQADHAQYATVDRGFDDATDEEKRVMLRNAFDRIKERSDAIESREQRAVRAHANGALSSSRLLETLLRNYEEAAILSESLDELDDRSSGVSNSSLPIEDEQGRLEMHRTDVRSQLAAATRGQERTDSDTIVTVKTSENGYVISMLDENYVREAVRFDNRNVSQPSQFSGLTDAYQYTLEMYPWANETRSSPSFNMHTAVQLYKLDISHDHGHLQTYLDGGTSDIHREVQVLNRDSLPVASQQPVTKGGLDLTVNKTVDDGPSKLIVSDSKTGELRSATISVDGTEVGKTGADGTLWFVPPGGGYELTVETTTGKRISTSISG